MRFSIEQARKFAGITQADMSGILNISRNTYISLEKKEQYFRVDQIYKFSEVTGIPIKNIDFYTQPIELEQ